jgi:hypothetical protein
MYEATIQHHSISRARSVKARSLSAIKRKAASEFRDEQRDYTIVVYDASGEWFFPVARRKVSSRRWQEIV